MIIDASDLIVGRLAAVVAKKALLGEKIDIINCEKAVITGSKSQILARFRQKKERGIPAKGPFLLRSPHMIVKRTIRGMLPYKQEKGDKAFKSIKCYKGVPEVFKDKKIETIEVASVEKVPNLKYITIGDISKWLGAKQ